MPRSLFTLPLIAAAALACGTAPAAAAATTVHCGEEISQDTRVANDLLNCPGTALTVIQMSPKRSSASEGADRESACQRDAISARRGRLTTASTWPHKAARADGARRMTPRYCCTTKRRSFRSLGFRPKHYCVLTRTELVPVPSGTAPRE
jgi:hypothetical protein